MAYLLDADVFIRAKNLHYGLDFCPAFWDWLIAGNGAGKVFSIEKVGDEVQAVADDLSEWAAALADGFFLRPNASVFPALEQGCTRKVLRAAEHQADFGQIQGACQQSCF